MPKLRNTSVGVKCTFCHRKIAGDNFVHVYKSWFHEGCWKRYKKQQGW